MHGHPRIALASVCPITNIASVAEICFRPEPDGSEIHIRCRRIKSCGIFLPVWTCIPERDEGLKDCEGKGFCLKKDNLKAVLRYTRGFRLPMLASFALLAAEMIHIVRVAAHPSVTIDSVLGGNPLGAPCIFLVS
jgi:hypothetical protein